MRPCLSFDGFQWVTVEVLFAKGQGFMLRTAFWARTRDTRFVHMGRHARRHDVCSRLACFLCISYFMHRRKRAAMARPPSQTREPSGARLEVLTLNQVIMQLIHGELFQPCFIKVHGAGHADNMQVRPDVNLVGLLSGPSSVRSTTAPRKIATCVDTLCAQTMASITTVSYAALDTKANKTHNKASTNF